MAKLIKMVRDTPEIPGGPTTADVCEAAVNDFKFYGWKLAEEEPKKNAKQAEPKVEPKTESKELPKAEPKLNDDKKDVHNFEKKSNTSVLNNKKGRK